MLWIIVGITLLIAAVLERYSIRHMREVEGVELCITHGGIMTEGTDYHPDGWGCQYPVEEDDRRCVGVPMWARHKEG